MLREMPPEVVMEIQQDRIESAKIPVEEPKTKVAEVQTMYRDSEA
jgi:hypothetical protein